MLTLLLLQQHPRCPQSVDDHLETPAIMCPVHRRQSLSRRRPLSHQRPKGSLGLRLRTTQKQTQTRTSLVTFEARRSCTMHSTKVLLYEAPWPRCTKQVRAYPSGCVPACVKHAPSVAIAVPPCPPVDDELCHADRGFPLNRRHCAARREVAVCSGSSGSHHFSLRAYSCARF